MNVARLWGHTFVGLQFFYFDGWSNMALGDEDTHI